MHKVVLSVLVFGTVEKGKKNHGAKKKQKQKQQIPTSVKEMQPVWRH